MPLVAAILPASGDWRTASRAPTGLAPDPATTHEAVVQVYAARAWGWRGRFAVHTWIAAKPAGAPSYTVYEVIGWRQYHGLPALIVHNRAPDARWFGAVPQILYELRGDGVDAVIQAVDTAARSYPYAERYRPWPGPNSNTFTAYVARKVPPLRLDLPPTAVGKDYLGDRIYARAPSNTGVQVSLFGLAGIMLAREEGLEINLFGLVFGIDLDTPGLKLPMIGRIPGG